MSTSLPACYLHSVTTYACVAGIDPRRADLSQHGQCGLPVFLPHIASRRPAAARRQPHQLHAELIEIAVAAGVVLLDLDPELIEGHRLLDEHAGDLGIVPGARLVDQPDAPLRPEITIV